MEEIPIVDKEKGTTKYTTRAKSNNAYILVYQRVHATETLVSPGEPDSKEDEQSPIEKEANGEDGDSTSSDNENEEKLDGADTEDSVSEPNMTPNVSSTTLNDLGEEKPAESPVVGSGGIIPITPATPAVLTGGPMIKSPSFLALLFLAKISVAKKKKAIEEEKGKCRFPFWWSLIFPLFSWTNQAIAAI